MIEIMDINIEKNSAFRSTNTEAAEYSSCKLTSVKNIGGWKITEIYSQLYPLRCNGFDRCEHINYYLQKKIFIVSQCFGCQK